MRNAIDQVERQGMDGIITSQICRDGLGDDLQQEADAHPDGFVRLRNLIEYIYNKTAGVKIISALAGEFELVDILSHYGGYYKFRAPRNQKTIGSIFGMIENRKDEFMISEYSVS